MSTKWPLVRDGMHRYTSEESLARFGLSCPPEDGMTKGSFADECDINKIMARYERTGQLPEMVRQDPRFGDFSDVPSYQESLERVMFAEAQFMALPAKVRAECENDPAIFLEKIHDKDWCLKHELALPSKADLAAGQAAVAAAAGQAASAGTEPAPAPKGQSVPVSSGTKA